MRLLHGWSEGNQFVKLQDCKRYAKEQNLSRSQVNTTQKQTPLDACKVVARKELRPFEGLQGRDSQPELIDQL